MGSDCGRGDREARRYAPAMICPVDIDGHVVQHGLFCSLLPVVPSRGAEADILTETVADCEHPLAMYLFTGNLRLADRVMRTQRYGGGCVDWVCIHMMVKGVPSSGAGHSGTGACHGRRGFRGSIRPQTVPVGGARPDLPLRGRPCGGEAGERKLKILRVFER